MRDNYFSTFLSLCLIVIVSGAIVRPLEDEDNDVKFRRSPQSGTYPNTNTGVGQYPNYGNIGIGQYPNYGHTSTGYNPNYSEIRTGQYPNYGSTGTGGQNTYQRDWLYTNRPSAPQGPSGNLYPTLSLGRNYQQYYPNYANMGSRQNPNYGNTGTGQYPNSGYTGTGYNPNYGNAATGQYPNFGSTGTGGQNTYQTDWLYPNRPSAPKWPPGNLYPTLTTGSKYPQYYPGGTRMPHSNQGYVSGTTYPVTPGTNQPGGYYDTNYRFGQPGFTGTLPTYRQPGNQNPNYGPGGYRNPGYGTINPSQYPSYGSGNPNQYSYYGNTGQRKY